MNATNNKDNNKDNKDNILILDLINQLENLGAENNKDDFTKNYTRLKNMIEKTDIILNNDNNNDLEQYYKSLSIQELFNIFESYNEYIINPENIDAEKLNLLNIISKILEEKIESETMNIFESK